MTAPSLPAASRQIPGRVARHEQLGKDDQRRARRGGFGHPLHGFAERGAAIEQDRRALNDGDLCHGVFQMAGGARRPEHVRWRLLLPVQNLKRQRGEVVSLGRGGTGTAGCIKGSSRQWHAGGSCVRSQRLVCRLQPPTRSTSSPSAAPSAASASSSSAVPAALSRRSRTSVRIAARRCRSAAFATRASSSAATTAWRWVATARRVAHAGPARAGFPTIRAYPGRRALRLRLGLAGRAALRRSGAAAITWLGPRTRSGPTAAACTTSTATTG